MNIVTFRRKLIPGTLITLSGLVIGFGSTPTAQAQENNTQTDRSSVQSLIEEIIVTARRREESLQEVPIAITQFSATDLAEANITRMEDLASIAPGLTIAPTAHRANSPGFTIRGHRQDASFITNDTSVGIYMAEAIQPRAFGLTQALFDLESVEVVRGPQGTLFGRNTTGGAILFQPQRPSLEAVEGYGTVRLGEYGRQDFQGAVNIPLSDSVALRIGGNKTKMDGYVTNITNGQEMGEENTQSLRAILLVDTGNGFKNTTYIDYFDADQSGTPTRLTHVNPAVAAVVSRGLPAVLERQKNELRHDETEGNIKSLSEGSNKGITNITELDFNRYKIKNIFGYREVEMRETQDLDGTAIGILELDETMENESISNELQLHGESEDRKLTWITGLYLFQEDGDRATYTRAFGGTPNPRSGEGKNTSYSIYAQGDYSISENLIFTLGGRQTWDKREFEQNLRSAATNACLLCRKDSEDYKAFTYTANLTWKINQDHMMYFATRTGFRAGGFNSSANNAAGLTPFDPEEVTDYEIGVKSEWDLNGTYVRTNLAVYHQAYDDIQRTIILPVDGVPITSIFNAASADVNGGELELFVKPSDSFELIASAAYTDTKYTKFLENTGTTIIDRSGNTFAYIPEWTYRLGMRWKFHVGEQEISTSWDYSWQDHIYLAEFNSPLNDQGSYGLLSARIEAKNVFSSGVDIAVYGRNMTDERYYMSGGDSYSSLGVIYKSVGQPSMYGVEISYRF